MEQQQNVRDIYLARIAFATESVALFDRLTDLHQIALIGYEKESGSRHMIPVYQIAFKPEIESLYQQIESLKTSILNRYSLPTESEIPAISSPEVRFR